MYFVWKGLPHISRNTWIGCAAPVYAARGKEKASFSYGPPRLKRIRGSIASARLDAVISLAFHTSRSAMVGLIKGEKVFVNGRVISSASCLLKENDVISVRGYGKFILSRSVSKRKRDAILQKWMFLYKNVQFTDGK